LRKAESTSSVAIVDKHSFGCFLDIILNLRLSNDLYIESATIDAISDLFQKFKRKKHFPFSYQASKHLKVSNIGIHSEIDPKYS